jgi:hypothetical protein
LLGVASKACLILVAAAAIFVASAAFGGVYPPNVQNDVYGVIQGGAVNGIPTANDDNDNIPDINDAVNRLLGTNYQHNLNVDNRFVARHDIWTSPSGQPAVVALIGLTAAYWNTPGYYTDLGVGSNRTPLLGPYSGFGFVGDGSASNPYPANVFAAPGGSFGLFLYANQQTLYYSESQLNAGPDQNMEHLMAFALADLAGSTVQVRVGNTVQGWTFQNPFLVTWEDLSFGGGNDEDYDDMMYLFDSVAPIPEPSTLIVWSLLGASGVGIGWWRRRRKAA